MDNDTVFHDVWLEGHQHGNEPKVVTLARLVRQLETRVTELEAQIAALQAPPAKDKPKAKKGK